MEHPLITKFRNLDYEQKKYVILNSKIDFVENVLQIVGLDSEIINEAFVNAGTIEMIKLLIQYDVNVNFQDNLGLTALMNAIVKDKIDIVRFLVEECNINVNIQNKKGQTALMYAISKKNKEIVELLVNKGADVDK